MEKRSRTEYSARNTSVALFSRVTAILIGYVLRVIFTHTLSESYVGINGLFLDIVHVLSLTEMGIGTAITYALYRPIATEDIEKQKSLMRLYCWFYRIVAIIVAIAGLAVIPFMNVLIKDYGQIEHIVFIYLLYLINTVCSYLLIYKKTLMDAHQLIYIGTFYQTMSWVIQDILQILILIFTKNFILFLTVNICCTLFCNICISRKADSLYPYLKDKKIQPLPKEEKQDIFRNIRAMLMHKIGDVAVNNTDNLILSSFVGLLSVGCYSNYYLVIGSIRQLLDQIFQGITASVGNLGVTEDRGRVRQVFEAAAFMGQWMYGFAAICLYELLNPFVEMSFGKNYLFTKDVVLILCINFFINGMRQAVLVFRDSLGLFWFDRYKAVAEAVLNLGISLLLVKEFGTLGVFLGTLISMLLTSVWVEPYILYKHHLHTSSIPYFIQYILYTAVMGCVWLISDRLCLLVSGNVFLILVKRLGICIVLPNLILSAVYWKKKEFVFLQKKAMMLLREKRGR